jgi:uncharacterized protein
MPLNVGKRAIDRAVNTLERGASLDLAFFGGEPLVEAELILEFVDYARMQAANRHIELALSMTTNGTIDSSSAWSVMTLPEMRLAISHDGLPAAHDGSRLTVEQQGTSARVLKTIARLINTGNDFRVVMVVGPGNVDLLPEGMEFLYELGVRQFDPSLNLWTTWTRADGEQLKRAIERVADFWRERLPACSVSWFDEKIARFANVPVTETARCGFGYNEIAVTPAGHLYPCERLAGSDDAGNPMRLVGDVFDDGDFCNRELIERRSPDECVPCALRPQCNTSTCRCSNYIRTGDTDRPDGLLCLLDQACHREALRVFGIPSPVTV